MKKESFLRVLAIMKKLRVEYARLHPLAFWNYYRDFNVRWMFRDVRRVFVMAYRACQPHAASQQQAVALASKPQAASLGCIQDEEEPEWKKRRRERLGKAVLEPQVFVTRVRFLGEPHQQAANGSATGGHGSATGGQWVSHRRPMGQPHLDQLGTPSVRHHSAVPGRARSRSPRIND